MVDDNPEYKKVYDSAIKSIDLDYIEKRTASHVSGLEKAIGKIKGKKFQKKKDAMNAVVDAYIAYGKETGIKSIIDDPELKHIYFNEVKQFFDAYERQNKTNVLSMIKRGTTYKLLNAFLENFHESDLEKKVTYEISQKLPDDKSSKFYQDLSIHHIKKTQGEDTVISDEEKLEMGNYDNVLRLLASYRETKHTNASKKSPQDQMPR